MASLFADTNDSLVPKKNQPQPKTQGGGDIFASLPSDLEGEAVGAVRGLFSGDATAASRASANEALARSAQQYRQTSGSQMAPNIGQGSAIRSQQAVEGDIFQKVADTQLGFAEQEQAGKERAIGYAMDLEQAGIEARDRKLKDLDARMTDSLNILQTLGPDVPAEQAAYYGNLYGEAWREKQMMLGASITDEDVARLTQNLAGGNATAEDYELLGVGIDVWNWWDEGEGTIIADGLTGEAQQWADTFNDPNASEDERAAAAEKFGEVVGAAYWARGGNKLSERQKALLEESGLLEYFADNPSIAGENDKVKEYGTMALTGGTISADEAVQILDAVRSGESIGVPVVAGGNEIPGDILDWTKDARDSRDGKRAWRLKDSAYNWAKQMIETKSLVEGPDGRLYQVVDYWEPGTSSNDKHKAGYIVMRDVVSGSTFNYSGTHSFEHDDPDNWGGLTHTISGAPYQEDTTESTESTAEDSTTTGGTRQRRT